MNKITLYAIISVIAFILSSTAYVLFDAPGNLENDMIVKEHYEFDLESDGDLNFIVASLSMNMWEEQIFLDMRDINVLVGSDPEVELIRLFPNHKDGYSGGKSTWPDGYALHRDTLDGVRTWEEYSNNGTLLKSIKIYDQPEKDILIILK